MSTAKSSGTGVDRAPAEGGAPARPAPTNAWSRRHVLGLAAPLVLGACAALRHGGDDAPDQRAGAPASTGAPVERSAGAASVPTPAPLLWSAEFDGPSGARLDPAVWRTRTGAGGWGNGELQCYTDDPENVSLDGQGNLRLTMQRRDVVDGAGNAARYTSGRVETVETFDAARFEARMRVPRGIGLWAAFWSVGADFDTVGWPRCGEIDVLEHYDDTEVVEVVGHGGKVDAGGVPRPDQEWSEVSRVGVPDLDQAFHVYGVDLAADGLVFSIDGRPRAAIHRADRAAGEEWPFDQPQRLVLDLAMSRWLGDRQPPLPASLVVDWVRVYARQG